MNAEPFANLHAVPGATRPLMRAEDVAAALAIGRRTFFRLLSSEQFPPADVRIGRLPRWRPETLAAWLDARAADAKGGAK